MSEPVWPRFVLKLLCRSFAGAGLELGRSCRGMDTFFLLCLQQHESPNFISVQLSGTLLSLFQLPNDPELTCRTLRQKAPKVFVFVCLCVCETSE